MQDSAICHQPTGPEDCFSSQHHTMCNDIQVHVQKKTISIISENCPQKLSEPLAGFQLYDYLKEMIYSILISYCKNTLHLSILKKSHSDCRLKLVRKVWIILLSSIFLLNVKNSPKVTKRNTALIQVEQLPTSFIGPPTQPCLPI